MQGLDSTEYARHLYARRGEATFPRVARVSLGVWRPQPNECHVNVDWWCTHTRGYTPVRGWLYFAYLDLLPHVHFNAHSIVRNPEEELVDITPSQATERYPFILALESEQDYFSLVRGQLTRLEHIK